MEQKKIDRRTFEFGLEIIDLFNFLSQKNEYILSKQLLRCGTSIGANVEEAQAAQSRKDFLSKMSIASKEARETRYWLRLLDEAKYLEGYPNKRKIFDDIHVIINIITKIVKTTSKTT